MSFQGTGKSIDPICISNRGEDDLLVPAHRLDEFAAGYSLTSCSPAELISASPTGSIIGQPV
jgi:hypothetical protein